MKLNHDALTVSILVEWTTAKGNSASEIIPFKVFKQLEQYRAVPMIPEDKRKMAGIPEVIHFSFIDHCIISERSKSERTLELVKNLLRELMIQELTY